MNKMSNREIKFRYVLKGKLDRKFYYKWYFLNQIENGVENLFDIENYDIIAKDQYTGLKDKNGVEVYEDDIIKIKFVESIGPGYGLETTEIVGYIKWIEGAARFMVHSPKEEQIFKINSTYKIIGNIYENLELLEAGE
ncbi:MAG: YopX family protein [Promethearchaeota archaeon]